jgi:O-antigen/teichoic acid export membrane protein
MADLIKVLSAKLWIVLSLFLSGVLIARFTSPAEYGLYAAALSVVLILDGAIGSPLDMSGLRFASLYAADAARVDRFLGALFRLKLLVAVVGTAILALMVGVWQVPDWPGSLVAAVGFSAVCVMLLRSSMNYLQVRFRFAAYSVFDLVQATARFLLVLVACWLGAKFADIYLGMYGLGALIAFLIGVAWVKQSFLVAPWPDGGDRSALLRHAGIVSLVVLLGTITGRSDVLILEARGGAEWAGQYAAALHIASVVTLLSGYISVVSQPRIIPWIREGRMTRLVRRNLVVGTWLAFATVSAVAFLPELVAWVFGSAFLYDGPLLAILMIGTCFDLLLMPLLLPYALQLVPRYALMIECLVVTGYFVVLLIIPDINPMSMAWVVTAVRGSKFVFYLGLFVTTRLSVQSSSSL